MSEAVFWGALAFILAEAVIVAVLLLAAVRGRGHEWQRTEAERRLRPLALAFIEGSAADIGDLTLHEDRALVGLLAAYGEHLSGAGRERIARLTTQPRRLALEIATLQGARRVGDRRAAAVALGDIGACARRAEDRRAAGASGAGGPPANVDALIAALRDSDPGVRAAAGYSLGRTGAEQAVEPILHALGDHRLSRIVAGQAVSAMGRAALPTLARFAAQGETHLRQACVELIGTIGSGTSIAPHAGPARGGSSIPLLVALLGDPEPDVRAAAAWSLRGLGTKSSGTALLERLSDPSPLVRAAAAEALGSLGECDVVATLFELAEHDDVDVAVPAALAAARLDPVLVSSAGGVPGAADAVREAAGLLALGMLPETAR